MAVKKRITSVVVWEDPPPRRGGPGRHGDTMNETISAELRMQPGVWGRIGSYGKATTSASIAGMIRGGKISAYMPAGHFDAVARTGRDGIHYVYAVYLGNGDG